MAKVRKLDFAAINAERFIAELVGVHVIIPHTELAADAERVLSQLRAALNPARQ
jgi:hypothetical protein